MLPAGIPLPFSGTLIDDLLLPAEQHRATSPCAALQGDVDCIMCVFFYYVCPGGSRSALRAKEQACSSPPSAEQAQLLLLFANALHLALFGSTTHRVIHQAPCPVLAVHISFFSMGRLPVGISVPFWLCPNGKGSFWRKTLLADRDANWALTPQPSLRHRSPARHWPPLQAS